MESVGILSRQIPSFIRQRKNQFARNNIEYKKKKLTLVALAVQHVIDAVAVGALVRGVTLAHGVHLINRKIVKNFWLKMITYR